MMLRTKLTRSLTISALYYYLKKSNMIKHPVVVMRIIFSMVFTGKGLFFYLNTDSLGSEIGKGTFYRFLNLANVNWHKFLRLLCITVPNKKVHPSGSLLTIYATIAAGVKTLNC